MQEPNPLQPYPGSRRASVVRDLARSALLAATSAPIEAGAHTAIINRECFLNALRQVQRGMPRRRGIELTIRGDGKTLEMGIAGARLQVACDHAWQGTVTCSVTPFLSLLRRPLGGQCYRLVYREGRFCIGGWTVPARWDEPGPAQIELPIDLHEPEARVEASRYM